MRGDRRELPHERSAAHATPLRALPVRPGDNVRGALGGVATGGLIAAYVQLVGTTAALWTALTVALLVIVAGAIRYVRWH